MSDSEDSQNTYRSRYTRNVQKTRSMHNEGSLRAYRPPNEADLRRRYSHSESAETYNHPSSLNQIRQSGRQAYMSRPSQYNRRSNNVEAAQTFTAESSTSMTESDEDVSMEAITSMYLGPRNARMYGVKSEVSERLASGAQSGRYHRKNQILDDHADELHDKTSEFVLRYTPVECDADLFAQNYLLRTMENERPIKVFIVVTMYNEDADELRRTLKGVLRNIDTFVETEGEDAWKEICVCIVSDGRDQADKETLEYLEKLGMYNSDEMHAALDHSSEIRMHLFESTLMIQSEEINSMNEPLQAMFALKEHGGGKLDSHHWFFNAFSSQLQPTYCIMLDVGTKPEKMAIYKLYQCMKADPNVGGCCGEITTRMKASVNPWVSAQQFEYKIATILDKSMESVFGFISVLPGAFSAYRFAAIDGEPLQQYFKQIRSDISRISPFKGNMYLAEDRILCFEVLAEKNHKWKLKYISGATAATDVPIELTDLIKQRRRWLNGSLFAAMYAVGNLRKFLDRASHNRMRKSLIMLQFAFTTVQLLLSWFLIALFYLMFEFSVVEADSEFTVNIFRSLFLILTLVQFVTGLGNRPDEMPMIYFLCAIGYGVFFFYTLGLNAALLFREVDTRGFSPAESAVKEQEALEAKLAALGGIAVYFGAGLIHGELFGVLVSIIQYFFMLPFFLIGFPIYSFCNIHDISWGTKGLETAKLAAASSKKTLKEKEELAQLVAKRQQGVEVADARFRAFRSNLVIGWITSNVIFYYLVSRYGDRSHGSGYIRATYFIFFGMNAFKFFFCFIYIVQKWIHNCYCCRRRNSAQ